MIKFPPDLCAQRTCSKTKQTTILYKTKQVLCTCVFKNIHCNYIKTEKNRYGDVCSGA